MTPAVVMAAFAAAALQFASQTLAGESQTAGCSTFTTVPSTFTGAPGLAARSEGGTAPQSQNTKKWSGPTSNVTTTFRSVRGGTPDNLPEFQDTDFPMPRSEAIASRNESGFSEKYPSNIQSGVERESGAEAAGEGWMSFAAVWGSWLFCVLSVAAAIVPFVIRGLGGSWKAGLEGRCFMLCGASLLAPFVVLLVYETNRDSNHHTPATSANPPITIASQHSRDCKSGGSTRNDAVPAAEATKPDTNTTLAEKLRGQMFTLFAIVALCGNAMLVVHMGKSSKGGAQ
ncbi:MAG: hypothetical protein LBC18_03105 [Opitutaceae bacterium]|jgi:hypothetical protein|nr:hypothetical protein [Opitutaceae bacterium]